MAKKTTKKKTTKKKKNTTRKLGNPGGKHRNIQRTKQKTNVTEMPKMNDPMNETTKESMNE